MVVCHVKCVVPENTHTHPKEGHWKFQGRGWISIGKIFQWKYEQKQEISKEIGGEGSNQKKSMTMGMDIFWNHIQLKLHTRAPKMSSLGGR